jgi:ribosomal protein S18 acetylase RimI-like enzyme
MSESPHQSSADAPVNLRSFQGTVDYRIVADIRNQSALMRHKTPVPPIGADLIEIVLSNPERLCIAEADGDPVGFIFVTRAGVQQLDEFGTLEGESWHFVGPTCLPDWQGIGVEQALLDWLIALARKSAITKLIAFERTARSSGQRAAALEEADFCEAVRYYHMQLEMSEQPPTPGKLPDELELKQFGGEGDFDILWSVLQPAFAYIERDAGSYEQSKAIFSSLTSAYFPICLDSASGTPVGTIAMVSDGIRGQIATLGVIPSFQRRGIGSLLMARAIDKAWNLGVRTLELSVRVENPQAISIYERFGFQVISERTTTVLLKEV